MTNKELVREICKAIRSCAMNFPDGLREIRSELDAVSPVDVPVVVPKVAPVGVECLCPPDLIAGEQALGIFHTVPNGCATTRADLKRRYAAAGVKRRPGRPRKVRSG
jgi:hypothetical protein